MTKKKKSMYFLRMNYGCLNNFFSSSNTLVVLLWKAVSGRMLSPWAGVTHVVLWSHWVAIKNCSLISLPLFLSPLQLQHWAQLWLSVHIWWDGQQQPSNRQLPGQQASWADREQLQCHVPGLSKWRFCQLRRLSPGVQRYAAERFWHLLVLQVNSARRKALISHDGQDWGYLGWDILSWI